VHFALLKCNQLISNIMKTKKFPVSLHIVVVLIALLMNPPSLEKLSGSTDGFLQFLFALAFLLVMFYTCFLWLVPAYLADRKTGMFVLLAFIAANVITLAGYSVLQGIHLGFTDTDDVFHYGLPMHISGLHAMLFAATFGTLFRVVYEWYQTIPAPKNK
jgi:hypothetical protein